MTLPRRAILHVDMDAFYASVEAHDDPSLAGRPLLVGGTGGRGVVAAASYEARRYGIHSAMPMREALRRCPQVVCVKPRMERYREVSQQVFAVFDGFTNQVEGLSLDEAFLDVTGSQQLLGPPATMAAAIKAKIKACTGLTASVGVAHNKLLAKLASDMNKPDGLTVILPEQVTELLDALPVGRLHGIGGKTAARLQAAGLNTLGELRQAPDGVLKALFGRDAERMRARAAGIDERPVVSDSEERQVSAETTFEEDLRDPARMQAELAALADRTAARLRRRGLLAGVVVIKLRRHDFATFTRQRRLHPPSAETRVIADVASQLLETWLSGQRGARIRLLGVGVGGLTDAGQPDLFGGTADNGQLDAAIDRIRERFGGRSLRRGSHLG
ncbi:MAG: DNA polymerase IV [Steroidobacteraceae bacterium]